jgi:sulfite reductase beta subunit-like hemoprotein
MEPTTVTGKIGAVDNPELIENVPGRIIPIVEQEFEDFQTEADRFLDGVIEEGEFIPFRLRQGVYGQRQPGVQMIRIKLPFGGVTPEQLEKYGEVAETFAPLGKGHITTRQAVQFHHVPLAHVPDLLRNIAEAGLSSREGCGNTVRNVTGDPYAGVCEDEVFDTTPYAGALVRYFVRNELTQLLPRKCKIAFNGSPDDRALTTIHDIAFTAVERDGERGFKVYVGGGTSIFPRIAPVLYEYVPVSEFLKVSEAVLRIFNRCDELRKNRARARIKVYIDRIGMDEFRKEVDAELEGDWTIGRNFDPTPLLYIDDEEADAPAPPANPGSPNGDAAAYEEFVKLNVKPQRQDGFNAIGVKVSRGDLTPEQWRGLAAIAREYSGGRARTTQNQNLVLRWVRDEALYDVFAGLAAIDLADPGIDTVTDVVSCPGTDSCKLGITASMGLNAAVQQRLTEMKIDDDLTRKTLVRMSGCPNGCSQHHVASIGFNGASMKFGDKQVPAYIPQIGGRSADGKINFGHRLKVRVPAKKVPDAVERWIRHYEENRADGEEFADYVERVGVEPFEDLARDLALPVEFTEGDDTVFVDWQRSDLFKVERGEGECAV